MNITLKFQPLFVETTTEIDLVTVLVAILLGRQPREKQQCLHANLMSNNFRKTAVLKKVGIVHLSYKAKDSTNKF